MRLFTRVKRSKPAPLLSDSEMAELNDEVFGEDISTDRLFTLLEAVPAADRVRAEWVMDQHTLNRIRKAHLVPLSGSFLSFRNYEATRAAFEDRLIGLPIVIEPFAKLALRVRA